MRILFIILIVLAALSGGFAQHAEHGMVLIPQGEFMMGKDTEHGADFSPAHRVYVDAFYLDTREVTNAEYLAFCKATNHRLPEFWNMEAFRCGEKFPAHPVVGVSWYDAKQYAAWAGKRLPTEAEWEYAARGGLAGKDYPNGKDWKHKKLNNPPGEWVNQIQDTGKREPNGYLLYDMAGNVWEWTADGYREDYYQHSPTQNPQGPPGCNNRVIRGGSWHSGAMCKKVYYRKGLPGNWVDFAVGFRCARDVEDDE